MNEGEIGAVMREGMLVMIQVGGPPLMAGLVVGLIIALVQAVTQINDPAVMFVPKVLALCAALAITGPFMFASLSHYTNTLFDKLVAIGGS
jgi:flagellar biosynthetic protein FliQ